MVVVPLGLWASLSLTVPYSSWLSLLLKVVLFGIPAYLFPRWVGESSRNRFLMLDRAPSAAWIVFSVVLLALYALFVDRGQAGLQSVSFFFVLTAVLVSPVVEEILFRGVILQELSAQLPFALANLATSLLFLLYHVPVWMARGQSISVLGSLYLVAISLWLGDSLRRSESLWTCIIIHAANNLLITVL